MVIYGLYMVYLDLTDENQNFQFLEAVQTCYVEAPAASPEEVATLPQVQRKLRKLEEVDQQLARWTGTAEVKTWKDGW